MPGSVYAPVKSNPSGAESEAQREVCPLNVGDTWLTPMEGARFEDILSSEHPGLNRYSDPRGVPVLIDAIVEKVRARNGIEAERSSVLVSAGATSALAAVVGTLAAPGEEVLILAPFWPLIRGAVQAFRGTPVEVPFYDRVDSPEAALEAVRERLTERTVALYVCTPSNPTGKVLPEAQLAALAEFARSENLWLISDEVYEDYVYRGKHISLARFAPERTLTSFSFSKAYGMAGYRVGYLVGPDEVIAQVNKIGTHTYYSAPTAAQFAARRMLEGGAGWLDRARSEYCAVAESASRTLGIPAPEGSTFLFLDASHALDERGTAGLLADLLEDGVALSPGASCGEAYGNWVRLCYTSAPPDQVLDAIDRLAARLSPR